MDDDFVIKENPDEENKEDSFQMSEGVASLMGSVRSGNIRSSFLIGLANRRNELKIQKEMSKAEEHDASMIDAPSETRMTMAEEKLLK